MTRNTIQYNSNPIATHLIKRFYIYYFLSKFSIYFSFFAFYLKEEKNLTADQIITLFAIHSISKFIFEVPTGFFADRFGEKLSVVISSFMLFIGMFFLIYGNYYMVAVAQLLFGLGETFSSGSNTALAYHFFEKNKIELEKNGTTYETFSSHYIALMWLSIGLSAMFGQILSYIDIGLPFYGTAIIFVLLIFATIALPNTQVRKQENISNIFIVSLKEIIKNTDLKIWLLISIVFSTAVVAGYLLIQPMLNEAGLAGPRNGMLYFMITLFAFSGSKLQPKINSILKSKLIFMVILCLILSVLLYALGIMVAFYQVLIMACLFRLVWGLASPLIIQEINFSLKDNSVRSSILSISSMIGGASTSLILYGFVLLNRGLNFNYTFLAIFMFTLTVYVLSLVFRRR